MSFLSVVTKAYLALQDFLSPHDALHLRVTCTTVRDQYRRHTRKLRVTLPSSATWTRFVTSACPDVHDVTLTSNLLDCLSAWPRTTSLVVLHLAHCGLYARDLVRLQLTTCLEGMTRLTSLDVSQNPLSFKGLFVLFQSLAVAPCRLEGLGLEDTRLTGPVPPRVQCLLYVVLARVRNLKLRGNRIPLPDIHDILEAAPRLAKLSVEAIDLQRLASSHPHLRVLTTSSTVTEIPGQLETLVAPMASASVSPQACYANLHRLGLFDTTMTQHEWCGFLETVARVCPLTDLLLFASNVTVEALTLFVEALARPRSLVYLGISRTESLTWPNLETLCHAMHRRHVRLASWIMAECPHLWFRPGADPTPFLETLHTTASLTINATAVRAPRQEQEDVTFWTRVLDARPNLTSLTLGNRTLRGLPPHRRLEVLVIPGAYADVDLTIGNLNFPSLKSLHLDRTTISIDQPTLDTILQIPTLRYLNLGRHPLLYPAAWSSACRLRTLCLSDATLGRAFRNSLVKALVRGALPTLAVLYFDYETNNTQPGVPDDTLQTRLFLILAMKRGRRNLVMHLNGAPWLPGSLRQLQGVVRQCFPFDISSLHLTVRPHDMNLARSVQSACRETCRLVLRRP